LRKPHLPSRRQVHASFHGIEQCRTCRPVSAQPGMSFRLADRVAEQHKHPRRNELAVEPDESVIGVIRARMDVRNDYEYGGLRHHFDPAHKS
jgi:hypothetical protein